MIKLILVIALFPLFFFVHGQTIQQTLEKLEAYNENHPQEKLYLQLDKYAYTAGETIWFKAYATIGVSNFFSNFSGIAYVELIDAAEQKVDSLVIPLSLGIGLGDIVLSDTITEGSYRLRAYTTWMRNAGDRYFYDRTIQISNGRSDNVMTHTVFREGEKNNIYAINISDTKGNSLPKTSVRYEVISKGKSVERKRASTDESGLLTIELPKKYSDAYLQLQFTNVEKATVRKLIKIVNPQRANHVELLPEGGKLLDGFINTVGIKAINSQGLGVKTKVFFTNGRDTLGTIVTNDLGMGALNLFVNTADSLFAFAENEEGLVTQVKEPEIHKTGYSLQVNNQNVNRLFAQLNVSSSLLDGQEVYFLVHHLGKVLFVSKQKADKSELAFSMPKKDLPSGVLTVTLLDSKFQPITERPIFNYNQSDRLMVDVSLHKQNYQRREQVQVNLQVMNVDSLKISALSASVLNVAKIKDNPYTAPNILSTLLLSSDLKGYIESPGYYFEDGGIRALDLDYLMLTQGWRNINWQELDWSLKPKFSEEKSLSISGYTKKLGRSKAESGAKIQMIPTGDYMNFLDTISNEDGFFRFDNILFPDSVKFIISAQDTKGKSNIDIVYNQMNWADIGDNKNGAEERWDINKHYLEELEHSQAYFTELERAGLKEKAILIDEVVVRARQTPKVSKNSRNLNGPGRADQILTAEDLSRCPTLEMCLAGRLLGVIWRGGIPYNTRGNVPMQVVLDGMFIEPDQISMLSTFDIESIEVLRNASYTSIYGSNGGNGIIVITSKTGESAMRSYTPEGIITIQPKGIHVAREFYAPKYDVSTNRINYQDFRTTIHWEPGIVTNKEGVANFSFFTADEKGKYIIVIEGLDLYGKICRVIKEIEIN